VTICLLSFEPLILNLDCSDSLVGFSIIFNNVIFSLNAFFCLLHYQSQVFTKDLTYMGAYGRIQAHTGAYRRIWVHMGAYRRIWAHMGTYRHIWEHMGAYRCIRPYMGTSNMIEIHCFGFFASKSFAQGTLFLVHQSPLFFFGASLLLVYYVVNHSEKQTLWFVLHTVCCSFNILASLLGAILSVSLFPITLSELLLASKYLVKSSFL
jgi:hypothetical protein